MGTQMNWHASNGEPGLVAEWLDLARRRWIWGTGIFLLVLSAVVAVVFLAHPVHRAEARLRLAEPPPSGGVSPTSGLVGLWRPGGDPFANDMELLGSRSVAQGVVEAAGLNAELQAPREWYRDSVFVAFAPGRDTERATFQAEWTADGQITIRRTAPSDSIVGTVSAGSETSFGGVTVTFRPWREGMPRSVGISTLPFNEAVRLTRQRLTAERVRRDANVLDLHFDHTDPQVTERAVAAWLDHFTVLRSELLGRETTMTVDSLRIRSNTVLAQLREAEEALEAFQRDSRLVAPEAQGEVFAERYGEARARLAETRLELGSVRSLLARVDGASDPAAAWSELAAHPRFVENETVGRLVDRLTELDARRQEIALRRTEENLEHRVILDQIRDLDRMLRSVALSYATALAQQMEGLQAEFEELDSELVGTPARTVELARLQRSVRLLNEIYILTEQRLRQEELREVLTFANVQVVDPPALRDRPVWPRRKLGLAVGLLLASGFGLLGMVVVERADGSLQRASQIRAVAGAPLLAAVPWSPNGRRPLTVRDASAVRSHARGGRGGRPVLVLAPVDRGEGGSAVVGWLAAGDGTGDGASAVDESPRDADEVGACLRVGPALSTYGAAVEAVGLGGPVALVAVRGRSRVADLRRAAKLLDEAGGELAGVILVCPRSGEVEDVWR